MKNKILCLILSIIFVFSALPVTYVSSEEMTLMSLSQGMQSAPQLTLPSSQVKERIQITVPGQTVYFKLSPSSTARYTFESCGEYDPGIILYDSGGDIIAGTIGDAGEAENFKLTRSITGGRNYYIGISLNDTSAVGSFDLMVRKNTVVDFSTGGAQAAIIDQYVPYGDFAKISTITPNDWKSGGTTYTFSNWTDGLATYNPGDVYSFEGDLKLDAEYSSEFSIGDLSPSLTSPIIYNSSNGAGTPIKDSRPQPSLGGGGTPSYLLTEYKPVRFPYTFLGWSTDADATTAQYLPSSDIGGDYSKNFYAVWSAPAVLNFAGSVEANADISVPGTKRFFKFAPAKTGTYVFESLSSTDTYGQIYNASGEQIAFDDDSGNGNNFKVSCFLSKGSTYYLSTRFYSTSKTGTVPLRLFGECTLSFHANGGTNAPAAVTGVYGSSVKIPISVPTNGSRSFLGWSTSPTASNPEYQAGGSYVINCDSTLYAVWSGSVAENFTVNYNYAYNGGDSSSVGFTSVKNGSNADLTITATKSGWEFIGWNTNKNATSALTSYTVTSNVTMYAIFKKNVSAKFYHATSSTPAIVQKTIYNNQQATITIPSLNTYSGWTAKGWRADTTADTSQYSSGSTITITSDKSFYGVYCRTLTLSYNANGGSSTPSSQTSTQYMNANGKKQSKSFTLAGAITKAGSSFGGWAINASGGSVYSAGTTISVSDNTVMYARWNTLPACQSPVITVTDKVGGKSVSISSQTTGATIYYTTDGTQPTTESTKYTAGFTIDKVGTTIVKAISVKSGYTNSAITSKSVMLTKLAKPTFTISEGRLTITGNGTIYYTTNGTQPTAVSQKYTGAISIGQTTEMVYAIATASGYVASDRGEWYRPTYIVTYNYATNGGASASQTSAYVKYFRNADLTVTATKSGWDFIGWNTDKNATSALESYTVTSSVTLYAIFARQENKFTKTDAFSFANSAASFGYNGNKYPITYETIKILFGDTIRAKQVYSQLKRSTWGGNCCGMTAASALIHKGTTEKAADYGRSNAYNMKISDTSFKSGFTLKEFIEAMQISQYSSEFADKYTKNLITENDIKNGQSFNDLYSCIKSDLQNDAATTIIIGKKTSETASQEHALLAYALDETDKNKTLVYVYDCNFPGDGTRYITLYKNSSGKYTGWEYNHTGTLGVWESTDITCYISYIPFSVTEYLWTHRNGGMFSDTRNQLLSVNSNDFKITDHEGNEVAKMVEGVLFTENDDIYAVPSIDADSGGYVSLYLPNDYYGIENLSTEDEFVVTMSSVTRAATVTTTAGKVSFAVDDLSNCHEVSIENASQQDTYTIEMDTSIVNLGNTEHKNVMVSGTGNGQTVNVSNATGGLIFSNGNIGSVVVNGIKKESCDILASTDENGTITPEGENKVLSGDSLTFTITPDEGYIVKEVYIDGVNVGNMTEYTFTNVVENHTIHATFCKEYEIFSVISSAAACNVYADYVASGEALLVGAVYDESGELISVSLTPADIGMFFTTLTFDKPLKKNDILKIFILSSLQNMVPLCEAYTTQVR